LKYLDIARDVLRLEGQAIIKGAEKLHEAQINKLIELFGELKDNGGSLILCGVGKSGLIGKKIASTFSSLGLPSYLLHPTEALHGDLGRVRDFDVMVFISNSGNTEEITKLLPFLPLDQKRTIGLLGNLDSPLADFCSLVFDCSVEREACKNNQAPTTSTSLALAMGDVMAVIFEYFVGLSREGFAFNHPGGLLGKSLRMQVCDIMISKQNCAILSPNDSLKTAILEMTRYPLGGLALLDGDKFSGILVDGDIRRFFTQKGPDLNTPLKEIMNAHPVSSSPKELAVDALYKMENRKEQISILPVLDEHRRFMGFIRLHDILQKGITLKKTTLSHQFVKPTTSV
jgi:arabinose-5-phosphate isomerase